MKVLAWTALLLNVAPGDTFAPLILYSQQRAVNSQLCSTSTYEYGLLFDCDGVILETEELHRLAYNKAFDEFDLTIDGKRVEWTVSLSNFRLLGSVSA